MFGPTGDANEQLVAGPGTAAATPLYVAPGTSFAPALDGTDATGVSAPTGAVGIRGWLSGLYSFISKFNFTGSGSAAALNVAITSGAGSNAASSTTAVAAAANAGAVKATAGTLYGVVVSTPGTAVVPITDGASGKVIAVVPANQPVGDVPFYGGARPFATSLYANTGVGSPALTFIYS